MRCLQYGDSAWSPGRFSSCNSSNNFLLLFLGPLGRLESRPPGLLFEFTFLSHLLSFLFYSTLWRFLQLSLSNTVSSATMSANILVFCGSQESVLLSFQRCKVLISVRFFRKCNTGPHWHSSNPTGSQNMSAAKSLLSLLRWPAGHGGLPSMACLRGVNSVCALSPVCSAAIASYTQFCIPSLYRNMP